MIDPGMVTQGSLFFRVFYLNKVSRGNGGVFCMLGISEGVGCLAGGRVGREAFPFKKLKVGCPG